VYGWPWPTSKVTTGHWPNVALFFLSQVKMELGSSNFAWVFPTSRQTLCICIVDLDVFLRSILIKFPILLYISSNNRGSTFNFAWSFPSTRRRFNMWIIGLDLFSRSLYRSFTFFLFMHDISQVIMGLGFRNFAWRFPLTSNIFSFCMSSLDLPTCKVVMGH
jgi:hypothetical protein